MCSDYVEQLHDREFLGRGLTIRMDAKGRGIDGKGRSSPEKFRERKLFSILERIPALANESKESGHLYVGNLKYDTNWIDIKYIFSTVALINHVEIPADAITGKSKGFARLRIVQVWPTQEIVSFCGMAGCSVAAFWRPDGQVW